MKGEYRTNREQIFDPSLQRYLDAELPTVTVKRAVIGTSANAGSKLATYTIAGQGTIGGEWSPGKTLRVTRLRVTANKEAYFRVTDSTGTIDNIYLSAAGQHVMLGAPDAPLYASKGHFYITLGTQPVGGTGTYSASFEGIVPRIGTETIS